MTFHHELYSAGVVKTRINSFTTVGIATNASIVSSVANGGDFAVEASYNAGESMNDVYVLTRYRTERNNISSPGSWYSVWNSTYSMLDITNDIANVVTEFKDKHSPTVALSGSDEAYRHLFTRFLKPTPDDAKTLGARAKKVVFDKAWKRCTSNRYPTNVVDGAYTPIEISIDRFDVGDSYTNVVAYGTIGSFSFNFGSAENLKDDEKRSSLAVGYEKRALPFAYWNFPSMNGNN